MAPLEMPEKNGLNEALGLKLHRENHDELNEMTSNHDRGFERTLVTMPDDTLAFRNCN